MCGWLDTSLQRVDIYKIFDTFKGKLNKEMKDKRLKDIPLLIQDMMKNGHIREELFDSAWLSSGQRWSWK